MAALITTVCFALFASEDWYALAVKNVEMTVVPATAKPGQTVTVRLTVDLHDGYHTYPTVQADKAAAGMVNKFTFPEPGMLIFVGEVSDPAESESKAEPVLGIQDLKFYKGKVVFERTAVVSPKAAAGDATIELPLFALSVCDKEGCYVKKLKPTAKLTVKGDAVPVEKAWATAVEKALAGK